MIIILTFLDLSGKLLRGTIFNVCFVYNDSIDYPVLLYYVHLSLIHRDFPIYVHVFMYCYSVPMLFSGLFPYMCNMF